MNETRIDLPNGDFTFRERKEWPFTVELGLGADGSLGVYNDEYTEKYINVRMLIKVCERMNKEIGPNPILISLIKTLEAQ